MKIHENNCINCGKALDGVTCVGLEKDIEPSSGDITVCIFCGHIMAFDDNLVFRELIDEEIICCAADPRIIAIQKTRQILKL